MQFQKNRNPDNLLIEERAAELAAKGYPPIDHDNAMDAESLIKEARKNNKVKRERVYGEQVLGR